eukprot:COSAG01_NODE_6114_length_3843_cov_2.175481_4_plen_144_part_00
MHAASPKQSCKAKPDLCGLFLPVQGLCSVVDKFYGRTRPDTLKVQGAMLTTLDDGVGSVWTALSATHRPFLLFSVSDNVSRCTERHSVRGCSLPCLLAVHDDTLCTRTHRVGLSRTARTHPCAVASTRSGMEGSGSLPGSVAR